VLLLFFVCVVVVCNDSDIGIGVDVVVSDAVVAGNVVADVVTFYDVGVSAAVCDDVRGVVVVVHNVVVIMVAFAVPVIDVASICVIIVGADVYVGDVVAVVVLCCCRRW